MGFPKITNLTLVLTKSLNPITKNPIFYTKNPIFYTKNPIFYTKNPIFYTTRASVSVKLDSKIIELVATSPETSVTPFLEQWVKDGNIVPDSQLQRIVRTLRNKRIYHRALEVSEWMNNRRADKVSEWMKHWRANMPIESDLAVQLDLIGRVHGVDAAEKFFTTKQNVRSEKLHGALLYCYVRERLTDKALKLFNKMKHECISQNRLTYHSIMNLYSNTGQPEKIPEVLLEMKAKNVRPDNLSYRLCIKSYGLRSDLASVETIVREMESNPTIEMGWVTYSTVANYYIEAGLHEKARYYLRKAEDAVNAIAVGYHNLISTYASLGDASEVMRLWRMQGMACKKRINIDYMVMLTALGNLGELEEAEKIFKDWKASVVSYDFRVPNALLNGLAQSGKVDKAEKMLKGIIGEGETPIPNSWSIIASGYVLSANMEKAVECMKRALALAPKHEGWVPKRKLVTSLLDWLAENGDVDEVEAFIDLLVKVGPVDRAMYWCLIKARVRHGREVDDILQRMKDDNIDVDEEMHMVIGSRN